MILIDWNQKSWNIQSSFLKSKYYFSMKTLKIRKKYGINKQGKEL